MAGQTRASTTTRRSSTGEGPRLAHSSITNRAHANICRHCRYGHPEPVLIQTDFVDVGNRSDEAMHNYSWAGNLSAP